MKKKENVYLLFVLFDSGEQGGAGERSEDESEEQVPCPYALDISFY